MMNSPSSILITGGASYIGSHVALALLARGERMVVLDDLSNGRREAVADGVPFIEGDIADRTLVKNLLIDHGIDTIMHFAGSISVPESVENPEKYFDNNTRKTDVLIDVAVAAGVRYFIFSSSAAVYGMPEQGTVDETFPTAPINPYGETKLLSERALENAAQASTLKYIALRYFNVAGADAAGRAGQFGKDAQHLIRTACQTALGMRPSMSIFGDDFPTPDGSGVRDYIHVSDLADAHLAALGYLRGGGESGIFNCGYGHGHSVKEVVAATQRVSGVDIVAEVAPRRPGDPAALVADNTRIMNTFDWQPKHDDLDDIIASALAWERRLAAFVTD